MGVTVLTSHINDLFSFFYVLRLLLVVFVVTCNVAIEGFVYISALLTAYRCFQIMDARASKTLTVKDYFKILGRKFRRLAPPYYLMWVILWAFTPRISEGPLYYNALKPYQTCEDNWPYTLLFVGNLFPNDMTLYEGCY